MLAGWFFHQIVCTFLHHFHTSLDICIPPILQFTEVFIFICDHQHTVDHPVALLTCQVFQVFLEMIVDRLALMSISPAAWEMSIAIITPRAYSLPLFPLYLLSGNNRESCTNSIFLA